MSILTIFFVAPMIALPEDVVKSGPPDTLPTVQSSGLTPLEMAQLLQITGGVEIVVAARRIVDFVRMPPMLEDGPWVVRLPDELVLNLANADANRRVAWASRWIESEELAGADLETFGQLLSKLGELARSERANGHGVYLWNSI